MQGIFGINRESWSRYKGLEGRQTDRRTDKQIDRIGQSRAKILKGKKKGKKRKKEEKREKWKAEERKSEGKGKHGWFWRLTYDVDVCCRMLHLVSNGPGYSVDEWTVWIPMQCTGHLKATRMPKRDDGDDGWGWWSCVLACFVLDACCEMMPNESGGIEYEPFVEDRERGELARWNIYIYYSLWEREKNVKMKMKMKKKTDDGV